MSQRLALKYNTTPRDSCQHFLTSFFQFLCGGGITPSVIACGDATLPLLSPTVTSSPGAGEVGPQGDGFRGGDKVSGIAQRPPLGELARRKPWMRGYRVKSSPFRGSWRAAPERVQPYIITLYRQCETQTGIDCGLYYPPESILCCQEFPCKILSRKISAIFGDCYKTQNIVVFCLTCH